MNTNIGVIEKILNRIFPPSAHHEKEALVSLNDLFLAILCIALAVTQSDEDFSAELEKYTNSLLTPTPVDLSTHLVGPYAGLLITLLQLPANTTSVSLKESYEALCSHVGNTSPSCGTCLVSSFLEKLSSSSQAHLKIAIDDAKVEDLAFRCLCNHQYAKYMFHCPK